MKKTNKEINEALDKIMAQYQKAGEANYKADTIEKKIWSMTILDKCSTAIDTLSWVLGDGEMEGTLTGECCDPFNPYIHENKETEEWFREGYTKYINDLLECYRSSISLTSNSGQESV